LSNGKEYYNRQSLMIEKNAFNNEKSSDEIKLKIESF
jgi:hypothetical protein